jgi:hypothetical protein
VGLKSLRTHERERLRLAATDRSSPSRHQYSQESVARLQLFGRAAVNGALAGDESVSGWNGTGPDNIPEKVMEVIVESSIAYVILSTKKKTRANFARVIVRLNLQLNYAFGCAAA